MAKVGRKALELNESEIIRLASIGCNLEQIAEFTGASPQTLSRRFGKLIKESRDVMKASLLQKQYQVATEGKGNVAMLIWLGKQHLGQSDKVDSKVLAGNMVNDLPRPKRNVLEMPKTGTDK